MFKKMALFPLFLGVLLLACSNEEVVRISAPVTTRVTQLVPNGETVIPNGRILTPLGKSIRVAPHPFGAALSPNGNILVTSNNGGHPWSISVIDSLKTSHPRVRQFPPEVRGNRSELESCFMGLAIAPNNRTLFISSGDSGNLIVFDLPSMKIIKKISLNVPFGGRTFEDSYPGDMVLSKDGHTLFVVDQANFRVVALRVPEGRIINSIPVGRYPYGIALTPDGRRMYVANVGMFEYSVVPGYDPEMPDTTGLPFPPFGFNTPEAKNGITIGVRHIPGLGDPNVPESFSVWAVDVTNPAQTKVLAKIKTGILVGEKVDGIPAVGGSSPNSVVATNDHVYVSNGNNDLISVIDIKTNTIVREIPLTLSPYLKGLRGTLPFGLALNPDGTRLFVAEAGINAVAVVSTQSDRVLGHLPAAWFPSKVAVSPDGKTLYVINAKGFGAGPNGGMNFTPGPEGVYIGDLMKGVVSIVPIPGDSKLPALTQKVIRNNFKIEKVTDALKQERAHNPIPLLPGQKGRSPIRYIVYITKENRTFDQVFGDMPGVNGDSSIAYYGMNRTIPGNKFRPPLKHVDVMPNHRKLAKQFALSDNFYCDSDVSADGHRWMVGTYPNEWVETGTAASYGGGRSFKLNSTAPGRLLMTGASGAVYPEDYNEKGGLWEHMERSGVDFFNFGLGFEFAGNEENHTYMSTGIRLSVNYPMPEPLFRRTSRFYATFNTQIPDQFRLEMFEKEVKTRWLSGKEPFPTVITLMLPNDHGSGIRPDEGYPYGESYQADNDLALGKLVEFLSRTPYWKNMVIFVTEDDAQSGQDHVDAHRSILLVIGPTVKHGYVSHVHASFESILKTIDHVTGMAYLNQYEAGANDLADFFTDTPDTSGYTAVPVDSRLFDPEKALDPYDPNFDWEKLDQYPKMDDPTLMRRWLERERQDHQPFRRSQAQGHTGTRR
ncbi:MAG: hypothetical protein GXO76_13800 [Calditrichaeota bacterium]|nr:hypothetical protein [Calditrichota bacterium]